MKIRKLNPLMGVMKTFDLSGKVCDSTFYFGRGAVKFGAAEKSYLLARVALVTPEAEIPIHIAWSWGEVPQFSSFNIDSLRFWWGGPYKGFMPTGDRYGYSP